MKQALINIAYIDGGDGNDWIEGSVLGDDIRGGNGSDRLLGWAGADLLTGGAGADRFQYTSIAHSSGADRDRISDFSQAAGDLIDLATIDADITTSGNQAFTYLGVTAFTGIAGQLRHEVDGLGDTHVLGDVDGDTAADIDIILTGAISLSSAAFVL